MYSSKQIVLIAISIFAILIDTEVSASESSDSKATSNEATNQYQPLYVVKKINRYYIVDSATYKDVMNQQIQSNLKLPDERNKMLAACTKTPITDDRLLDIMPVGEKQIVDGYRCEEPVEFFVKQKSQTDDEHYIIGFMIYDDDKGSISDSTLLSDLPLTHYPIDLIKVALVKTPSDYFNFNIGNDIKYENYLNINTRHDIKYAKMLSENEHLDQNLQNRGKYEKNISVYGYDIDAAYEPENQSKYIKAFFESPSNYKLVKLQLSRENQSKFIKVFSKSESESNYKLVKLQLSPVGDFFFEAQKRASFNNINTTPVWDILIPEWHQLEKFIRRVAEVVGDLQIITGGIDSFDIPNPEDGTQIEFYKSENSPAIPVFETIFKAISFSQKSQDNRWIRQGIVFYLINDPREIRDFPDILAEDNGWKYLEDRYPKPKILAKPMDRDTLDNMGVTISYTYEIFNLKEFKKFSKNEQGEEVIIKVDLLEEMEKNKKAKAKESPNGEEILEE
ncbi:uncharacterized protein LOC135848178 [Planococcus citri]|uniref:uncharacterized protein LOC135848178 n=1 Tax=Planococcus citri TaxID=170843 RepID=UPI0031F7DBD9